MSKLHQILISTGWEEKWSDESIWLFPRDVSSHFSLVVVSFATLGA